MTKTDCKEELELYIHIPFCVQKCKYCDFLSAPAAPQVQSAYMEALLREIRECAKSLCVGDICFPVQPAERTVSSIFIGGGTPSAVETRWIERLMDTIKECYRLAEDAEISIEVNPGTVTAESLTAYRRSGINRLSIGCQSTEDGELERIGRIHTFAQFLDTYRWAREAGFDRVNVDVMNALPGQEMEDVERNLKKILKLQPAPEHLSVYSLIIEEGTPFHRMWERGELEVPDEDTEREMYWRTAEILRDAGYEHYEISNFAKKGCRCRHNCGYWTGKDYLGFGTGAASLYGSLRFSNTDQLAEYMENPAGSHVDLLELTQTDRMEETMFLGLRMADGVDCKLFAEKFGVSVEEVYRAEIAESIQEGLLEIREDRIVLTKRGVDVSNYVMAKFLHR